MWRGTPNQRAAIEAIEDLKILDHLKEFDPLVAGTIPIDVDLEGADIDLVCTITDYSRFLETLKAGFLSHKNFQITESYEQGERSILARFEFKKFRFEVFGQKQPSKLQNAYRHMVAEHRLLQVFGPDLQHEVRLLKQKGIKTEPAFAMALGIEGDPFEEILKLEELSEDEIKNKFKLQKNADRA